MEVSKRGVTRSSDAKLKLRALKKKFLNQKIMMVFMPNDPDPIKPGSLGVVESITDIGSGQFQVSVNWEVKRGLKLIYPQDIFQLAQE